MCATGMGDHGRAMKTVTRNKKGFKNWCFSFRSHNLGQIMGSQQIPSAVQFRSQVIWKMENTSLASVSPGTATKKQASMEGKHRTRKSVNQTSSNGGQRHTQPSGGLPHLEVWQELTGSQQTTLIVVHCENHVSSLKLKVRVSEVWMTSTISYNARSWGRSRTACWGNEEVKPAPPTSQPPHMLTRHFVGGWLWAERGKQGSTGPIGEESQPILMLLKIPMINRTWGNTIEKIKMSKFKVNFFSTYGRVRESVLCLNSIK